MCVCKLCDVCAGTPYLHANTPYLHADRSFLDADTPYLHADTRYMHADTPYLHAGTCKAHWSDEDDCLLICMQRIQWQGGVPVGQRGAEAAPKGHAQASRQPHSASGNPIRPCACPRHGQLCMTSVTYVYD